MMDKNEALETLADSILRAAGSSLSNYTMPGTRQAILNAVSCAVQSGANTHAVTDEMVERAIAPWYYAFYQEHAPIWPADFSENEQAIVVAKMRAALTAALGGENG